MIIENFLKQLNIYKESKNEKKITKTENSNIKLEDILIKTINKKGNIVFKIN